MKPIRHCIHFWVFALLLWGAAACQQKRDPHAAHQAEAATEVHTCPMHPEIIRNAPGSCPICGMDLVKKETGGAKVEDVALEALLKPANAFVISTIPVTTIEEGEEAVEVEALGRVAYDTRLTGTISSRISGRIERLYVRYRFQYINKGQRIMDVYSPELMTAQQNLLFLLKNDPDNTSLISAAKQRLFFLGMTPQQVQGVVRSGKPSLSVAVYSNQSGHLHEAASLLSANMPVTANSNENMNNPPPASTQELTLKEGMYVQKGQSIFSIYNASKVWALLQIYGEQAALVKVGNPVRIVPETAPNQNFRAKIDFIEPFYRPENKTLTARVYFNNTLNLPVGSQVRATVFSSGVEGVWLPREAVLSLGLNKIVFRKEPGGFRAHGVSTGVEQNNRIQITGGLSPADSVAVNAQYLMDNESFIKAGR